MDFLPVTFGNHDLGTGTVTEKPDLFYRKGNSEDSYQQKQCCVDLYLPKNQNKPFPILVWFHGGGLEEGARNEEGHKAFARRFARAGVGMAMAGYRLSPRVQYPVYIQDAAMAVQWTVEQASAVGSDPSLIYVGGHSAGGYLAAMLALDGQWLEKAGGDAQRMAGFIPMSAQVMTHFNIRKERGWTEVQNKVSADETAPIYHLRKDTPPILLILGDNDFPARLEENQYFVAVLEKIAGNKKVSLLVVKDRDHGTIVEKCLEPEDPAGRAMLRFMQV